VEKCLYPAAPRKDSLKQCSYKIAKYHYVMLALESYATQIEKYFQVHLNIFVRNGDEAKLINLKELE